MSRLNASVDELNRMFEAFQLGNAVAVAYRFWMNELCAIFLEGIKPIMRSNDEQDKLDARVYLYEYISKCLRIIHPMMPFVSEELY